MVKSILNLNVPMVSLNVVDFFTEFLTFQLMLSL
jgi:hypothetical protein